MKRVKILRIPREDIAVNHLGRSQLTALVQVHCLFDQVHEGPTPSLFARTIVNILLFSDAAQREQIGAI
jgi:hypothetical protein